MPWTLLPPSASVCHGAAGVAYFCYRGGVLLGRSDLIEDAETWIRFAEDLIDSSPAEALYNPTLGITHESVGNVSLWYSETGVFCVAALIAAQGRKQAVIENATDRFISAGCREGQPRDLVAGIAGLLVGCTLLLEATRASGGDEQRLLALGHELQLAIQDPRTPRSGGSGRRPVMFGMAHGWAGEAYAVLRFCDAAGMAVPAPVRETIDELAELAVWDDGQASWPYGLGRVESLLNWCHGTAGYTILWTCAHRVLGDARYLDLAVGAAEHSGRGLGDYAGHICCGRAGQGYAMLSLYRSTRDNIYLERARRLLGVAVSEVEKHSMLPDSLLKGDLGVALLELEVGNPLSSAMPLLESEAWLV